MNLSPNLWKFTKNIRLCGKLKPKTIYANKNLKRNAYDTLIEYKQDVFSEGRQKLCL